MVFTLQNVVDFEQCDRCVSFIFMYAWFFFCGVSDVSL